MATGTVKWFSDDKGFGVGREKIVDISPELVRRFESTRHVGVAYALRRLSGQKRKLNATRETKLLFDALFVATDFLIQTGVVDRDGSLAGQQREQFLMFLAECVELGTLQIENADASILDEHRNH